MKNKCIKTKVLVIGGGPGGYSAAFRCSDLGLDTILIEESFKLGGVCLNYGCIPSKSLLHFSKTLNNVNKFYQYGIIDKKIDKFNIDNLNLWKNRIIGQISKGLTKLSELRNIKIIYGHGKFINKNLLEIYNSDILIEFEFVIISTGSRTLNLNFKYKENIWDSKKALEIPFIPNKLLIIGAGIIGIEMATIYQSLGSKVNIVDTNSEILQDIDKDVVETFINITKNKFTITKNTLIESIDNTESIDSMKVNFKNLIDNKNFYDEYNAILISIGRIPNTDNMSLDKLSIKLDKKGFIIVDENMRTNVNNIYAIGDVVGMPMLAHKAIHEAKIASDNIFDNKNKFNTKIIPSIMYSDPEIAWVGINEKKSINQNINYGISKFPWSALGKSIINDCNDGFTKLIFNKENNRIIGGAIIGKDCSEMIGEITLAIEMCCNSEDISLMIHSHPTLYESIGLASSYFEGTVTDILNKK